MRSAYKILVGKPLGKWPCGKLKRIQEEVLRWFSGK
jgi:hypothetical protein